MQPFLSTVTFSRAPIKRGGISVYHEPKLKTLKFSAGPLNFLDIWLIVSLM
jgi:hypothetical protein